MRTRQKDDKIEYLPESGNWAVAAEGFLKVYRVDNWNDKGTNKSGLIVVIDLKSGGQSTIFLSAAVLRKRELTISELCDAGLRIQKSSEADHAILEFLDTAFQKDAPFRVVHRAGWQDDSRAYVTNDGFVIGPSDRILLQSAIRRASKPIKQKLSDWQSEVGDFVVKSTTTIVAVCIGLSACLLKDTNIEPIWIHISGPSSIGKTLTLIVVSSIFGHGRRGQISTMDVTPTGLEELAASHHDQVVVLDELDRLSGTASDRSSRIGSEIHRIASGMPRVRSKKYAPHQQTSWRAVVFSSGEISIARLNDLARRSRNQGEQLRIIDLPAIVSDGRGIFDRGSDESSENLAAKLEQGVERQSMVLGPSFISAYLADRVSNLDSIRKSMKEFLDGRNLQKNIGGRRYAKKFALGYATGILACKLGILNWSEDVIRDAFARSFAATIAHNTVNINHIETTVEEIRLLSSKSHRFVKSKEERTHGTYGYQIMSAGGQRYHLVSSRRFKKWCGDATPAEVASRLRKQGLLKAATDGNFTRQARVPGVVERARYYWLCAPSDEAQQRTVGSRRRLRRR